MSPPDVNHGAIFDGLSQTKKYLNLVVYILKKIGRSDSGELISPDVLSAIRRVLNFEAIGIRIKDGEDYPYYLSQGFSAEFIEAERYLCAYDPNGMFVTDDSGDPHLECMCGNVIRGNVDPSLPFFTEYGSFWTNSTTALLAGASETQLPAGTRNRCNSEGYESVALIPLHSDSGILGLLQLNDRRMNMFTDMQISVIEGIANAIGIAIGLRHNIKTF